MEDCKTVKSTENSLVVDYEGFTPEFFKAAQKALKWGATKTDFDDWYESKTNYSTETLDTICTKISRKSLTRWNYLLLFNPRN